MSNDNSSEAPNYDTDTIMVMSMIDAYGICMDQLRWKTENEVSAIAKIIQYISPIEFFSNLKFFKGIWKNKTAKDNTKIVINFYPYFSSSQLDGKVNTQYCKYFLIKYCPWTGSSKNEWNGTDTYTTDAEI